MVGRRTTRAAASTTGAATQLGDENRVSHGTQPGKQQATALSTKNAGLRGKAITSGAAPTKTGLAEKTNSAANAATRRRTALSDSSNKNTSTNAAPGTKNANGKQLVTVAEEKAAATNAAKNGRPRTRASIGKKEETDGDDAMENADRPIKSMRLNGAASTTSSTRTSNIPRKPLGASTGSTKNAGLKRPGRANSTVSVESNKPATTRTVAASTKGPKREILEENVGDLDGPLQKRRRSNPSKHEDEDDESRHSEDEVNVEIDEAAKSHIRDIIEVDTPQMEDMDDDEEVEEVPKDFGWEDLDIGDEEDPLMVAEYVKEIHEYMQEIEVTCMADPHHMKQQTEITWAMRSILVDWLIEVHGKFRLLPETIFLAVNILDRLLSIRTVSMEKYQLVGIVSLFIAAKYEEVICPSVSSFLYMTDGGYTDEEMLSAERYILKQIDFNLSYPNPINFLRRISKADGYDIQTRTVAKYFLEMTVVERRFLEFTPSMIAAAGMWLARKVLDRGEWNANLVHYSTYSQAELLPCAQTMLDYVLRRSQSSSEAPEHPHFTKKYAAKKFYRSADLVRDWAESRYIVKRASGGVGAASLFNALRDGGRLEEWDEVGDRAKSPDFD